MFFVTVNIWNPGLAVALFLALFPSLVLFGSALILHRYLRNQVDWIHEIQDGHLDLVAIQNVSSTDYAYSYNPIHCQLHSMQKMTNSDNSLRSSV